MTSLKQKDVFYGTVYSLYIILTSLVLYLGTFHSPNPSVVCSFSLHAYLFQVSCFTSTHHICVLWSSVSVPLCIQVVTRIRLITFVNQRAPCYSFKAVFQMLLGSPYAADLRPLISSSRRSMHHSLILLSDELVENVTLMTTSNHF